MKELLTANIFSGISSWKEIDYKKEVTPKVLQFEVTEGAGARPLYLASMISKEEKMAWQSFQDVLEHTMTFAQNLMHGFFGFDVLFADLQSGTCNFDPKMLAQLVANHAKNLGPDQKTLIRYGQLFALLHYRAPAHWGKVEVKTHVECLAPMAAAGADVTEASVREALMGRGAKRKSPGKEFDLFMKKMLKESGEKPGGIYVVNDLGLNPVWDPAAEARTQKIGEWLGKAGRSEGEALPEIYYYHAGKRIRVGN